MKTDRSADAAWHVVPELLGRLFHDHRLREVAAREEVGSATRLFHTDDRPHFYPFYRKLGRTTSFLVWRSGNTLAVVATVGRTVAEDDRAAVDLARRQQGHIRKPTRYTRAERFDAEVPLDNPSIEMPVYWLGRHFRPPDFVGENLFQAYFLGTPRPEPKDGKWGPLAPLFIGYGDIWLETWTPATWSVFADSKTGQAITSWKCTRTRTISLPDRTATIFGGYEQDFAQCPERKPDAFTAWVDIGGVKVVVNAPFAADGVETINFFGSFKGMEAIVRGLRLRPKPVYGTP